MFLYILCQTLFSRMFTAERLRSVGTLEVIASVKLLDALPPQFYVECDDVSLCPPSCLSASLYSSHLSCCLSKEESLHWHPHFLFHFPLGSTEKKVFGVNATRNECHPYSVNVVIKLLRRQRNR